MADALAKLMWRANAVEWEAEMKIRDEGRAFLENYRAGFSAALCAQIRLYTCELIPPRTPANPSIDWCNAAVLILDCAPDETLDRFIRGSELMRNAIVQAVLTDGGLLDGKNYFHELPPLEALHAKRD